MLDSIAVLKKRTLQTNAFEFKYLLAENIEYTIGNKHTLWKLATQFFLMPQNFIILKTLAKLIPYYLFYIS